MASLIDQYITPLIDIQTSRYLSVASYAVLMYDLVVTLPTEINLIWSAKWSIVKILFFIVRYSIPAVVTVNVVQLSGDSILSDALCVCQRVILILIYWQLVSLGLVDVIVSLRIHALWRRSRTVFVLLSALFVVTYAVTFGITTYIIVGAYGSISFTNFVNLCIALPPRYIWAIWLPGVVFETVVCVVTVVRTWQHWSIDKLPLREALLSDGLPYFLVALCARLLSLLVWGGAPLPPYFALLGEHFSFAVTGVVCSRLLLNLRSVQSDKDWSEATDIMVVTSRHTVDRTVLWVADQGGQSFLEQIYGRVHSPDVRPSFHYLDDFMSDSSP